MNERRDCWTICIGIILLVLVKGSFSQWMFPASNHNDCDDSDVLSDPNGEYNFYNDITKYRDFCLYIINEDSTLSISFKEFDFGFEDENGNCTNYLEIGYLDASTLQQSSPQKYCGSRIPPPFVTDRPMSLVRVHREAPSYQMSAENIELVYSTKSKCIGDLVITSHTFLATPKFPSVIPPGTSCEWNISSEGSFANQPLQIHLTAWSVSFNSGALIEIYDSKGGQFLARFDESTSSQNAAKAVITTSGPHAYVTFRYEAGTASFNATVKAKGYCLAGTLPCGDGLNCYTDEQLCDSFQDCSTGYDELGCGDCGATQFWCGKDDPSCYEVDQRCNYFKDCPRSLLDETNCKTCGPGSFLCKPDSKCIYERWRCDGDYDCSDRSDEQDCDYKASRRVITAAVIGSLVCSLLLVIALGCTCKLYSLRASHHRHPHHQYRATPLTRVERELFQRQAPPTYDMTISGSTTESSGTRAQRQRRRRNRRYQFQRTAPANVGVQSNTSNREESIVSGNTTSTNTSTDPLPQQSTTNTQQQTTGTTSDQDAQNAESQQGTAPHVIESIPDILAEMIFAPRPGQSNTGGSQNLGPARTSTPVPIETRDSGTQTNSNTNPGNVSQTAQSTTSTRQSPTTTRQTPTTSSAGRSARSSSSSRRRNRRSSGSSSSKDQQAKPLPKKKRILPVMVQAPCPDAVVEEDTLACVYPCPPSYSQAVASNDPKVENSISEMHDNISPTMSINDASEDTNDQVFTPTEVSSLTTTRSRFFSFSIRQALRSITSAFSKNPYLQMETQDSSIGANNEESSNIESTAGLENTTSPRQLRQSASSDESMIDCSFDAESLGPNNELQDMSSSNNMNSGKNSMTSGKNAKVFPQKKNNVNPFNAIGSSSNHDTSLDMSDFSSREDS